MLYKDINHDLYFPYERKIVKKFVGMFNINKNNLQLDVAAQNSFGKINYEVGNKVKINFDKDNIVGFF